MEEEKRLDLREKLDLRDLNTYTFHAEDVDTSKKLVWNVFEEDWNSRRICVHNIFDHGRFMEDLVSIKKECKEDRKLFEEKVRRSLSYYYWAKAEWEVIITSWPPYVESEEIDRLVKERKENLDKWGYFYRTDVRTNIAEKIDVFDQVRLNWNAFIDYLWNNRKLIKKKK